MQKREEEPAKKFRGISSGCEEDIYEEVAQGINKLGIDIDSWLIIRITNTSSGSELIDWGGAH
jgi:hypothetical protein